MIELLPEEKEIQEEISKLLYECVKNGAITFEELRFLFSFIAKLTLAGIDGRMIGEKLRNMVSPPLEIDVEKAKASMNDAIKTLKIADQAEIDTEKAAKELSELLAKDYGDT